MDVGRRLHARAQIPSQEDSSRTPTERRRHSRQQNLVLISRDDPSATGSSTSTCTRKSDP
ncbi:hypothetical protein BKA80DRAFT_283331 [Phyllosticta citrichinensis]